MTLWGPANRMPQRKEKMKIRYFQRAELKSPSPSFLNQAQFRAALPSATRMKPIFGDFFCFVCLALLLSGGLCSGIELKHRLRPEIPKQLQDLEQAALKQQQNYLIGTGIADVTGPTVDIQVSFHSALPFASFLCCFRFSRRSESSDIILSLRSSSSWVMQTPTRSLEV